ncbi:MAG: hypothetical protein AB7O73_12865 [Bacteroidia bacterium]|nr:hypothetical protein [Saprospiraceae bacterium]
MMEINEKLFIKGFNDGYILANHEPKLLDAILHNISPTNSYINGLSSGQKEFELETNVHDLAKLRQSRNQDRDLEL